MEELLAQRLSSGPVVCHVECEGPGFDDSDPLWEELALGLVEEGEDVGDADLPSGARSRLAASGQYWLVNEDNADEWICISGAALVARLEAASARARIARARRRWLRYDLCEAKLLWDEESSALRSEGMSPQRTALRAAAGRVARALCAAHAARGPPETDAERSPDAIGINGSMVSEGLEEALQEALAAVIDLRMLWDEGESRGFGSVPLTGGLDALLGVGTGGGGLAEVQKCLHRCLVVGRAALCDTEIASCSAAGVPPSRSASHGATSATGLSIGDIVIVANLTAPSEVGLVGQEGELERFSTALGLWQVRLLSTGTRLLLPASQVAKAAASTAASDHRQGRSRSPRGRAIVPGQQSQLAGLAASALELAREAARRGEYVLVHHVVNFGAAAGDGANVSKSSEKMEEDEATQA